MITVFLAKGHDFDQHEKVGVQALRAALVLFTIVRMKLVGDCVRGIAVGVD